MTDSHAPSAGTIVGPSRKNASMIPCALLVGTHRPQSSTGGYRDRHYLFEILSWSSHLHHLYYSSSFLRTPQINPSLRNGRSVIMRIQGARPRSCVLPSRLTVARLTRVSRKNGALKHQGLNWSTRPHATVRHNLTGVLLHRTLYHGHREVPTQRP